MAYDAKIIHVMLASPGDVREEKEIARSAILNWTVQNIEYQKIGLIPVSWDTHAAPDLAGRAQGLINDRILERCDLLVGIFWTRLGTPTGEHASGTVEEIKRHVASGRTAMVYFSSKPASLDTVDMDQYNLLKEFKEWCRDAGLISSFESLDDFLEQFRADLPNILRSSNYLQSLTVNSEPIESVEVKQLRTVSVSELAFDMLTNASTSRTGMIMVHQALGGTDFSAGEKSYPINGSHREAARHQAAVEELEGLGLIKDLGYQGEMFQLTNEGYAVLERMKEDQPT